MKLLAIDTSAATCSAALWVDGAIMQEHVQAPRKHGELILPMMQRLLAQAELRVHELDALAYARGPGSFTGIRIAASVIQGVALGAELKVIPISTLEALAGGCVRRHGAHRVLAALDARMGEVYWADCAADAQGLVATVGDDMLSRPTAVLSPDESPWWGVGSGWQAYREDLGVRLDLPMSRLDAVEDCEARDVVRLAAARAQRGLLLPPEQALPRYLRDQVTYQGGPKPAPNTPLS